MSSDSELSELAPDDAQIEKVLRELVREAQDDPVTVNAIRTAAEQKLGLDEGFFKSGAWKEKSKEIISDAYQSQSSPKFTKATSRPSKSAPKKESKEVKTKKRTPAQTTTHPHKRRKQASETETSALSSLDSDGDVNSGDAKVETDQSDKDDDVRADKTQVDSESEMSEVLDEAPPKKRRQKSASTESKPRPKAAKSKAGVASATKELEGDDAEIKKLQGWLVKCGIRKLWGKELKPYETARAKIKHLKDMLKDAGMDGRYSNEKARAIKEQRELAADLEAVQEGAKKWGHDDDEDEEDGPRGRHRAVAARFVDFGDSGEDSD